MRKLLFLCVTLCTTLHPIDNFFSIVEEFMRNDELEKALKLYLYISGKGIDESVINYDIGHLSALIGNHEQAIPYYEKAIMQEPERSVWRLSLAKTFFALGNFEKGLPLFEDRFLHPEKVHNIYNYLHLTPADFTGKKIIILPEWGFGDYIQFIRYAQLIKEYHPKELIVQTFPSLIQLLSRCPYIDRVISSETNPPLVDIYVPILSLPLIFKTTLASIPAKIPYIYADPQLITQWQKKISHDHTFKIGICWQAKKIYLEDHIHSRRSLPLTLFEQIARIPNIRLYSLQKGDGCEQIKNFSCEYPLNDFSNELDQEHGPFMDTAALICNLDLIISADTSIVHVAGALGAKVWVLLPHAAEWRWLNNRTDTPWYPDTMRLFRQPKPGDWQSAIDNVCQALKDLTTKQ